MSTTFTNGKVSITRDLVFGLSVLLEYDGGETGWEPLDQLTIAEFARIDHLIDHNPTFPWKDELDAIRLKHQEAIRQKKAEEALQQAAGKPDVVLPPVAAVSQTVVQAQVEYEALEAEYTRHPSLANYDRMQLALDRWNALVDGEN